MSTVVAIDRASSYNLLIRLILAISLLHRLNHSLKTPGNLSPPPYYQFRRLIMVPPSLSVPGTYTRGNCEMDLLTFNDRKYETRHAKETGMERLKQPESRIFLHQVKTITY